MAGMGQAGPGDGLRGEAQGGAGGQAQQVAGQVQDKAQQVAGQVQDKAQQAAGQAQNRVRSVIDERSTQAGEQISQQADDLRSVGEQLRSQGKEGPAKIADQAAERVSSFGQYLSNSGGDRILHDVEDLARRSPTTVAFAGLAVGFAASRFLKASSQQRFEQRSSDGTLGTYRRQIPAETTSGRTYGTGYAEPGYVGTERAGGLAEQPIAPGGLGTQGTASPVGSI